jgi:hypothetical protein
MLRGGCAVVGIVVLSGAYAMDLIWAAATAANRVGGVHRRQEVTRQSGATSVALMAPGVRST